MPPTLIRSWYKLSPPWHLSLRLRFQLPQHVLEQQVWLQISLSGFSIPAESSHWTPSLLCHAELATVIPGVLLFPSVATASTFTAGSGDTPSKSRDPRQISPSPPSPLPSSLGSHHTRAHSPRAGCPGERGGRVELSSGHSLHSRQSLSPSLALAQHCSGCATASSGWG